MTDTTAAIRQGDIVNNGSYDIFLLTAPVVNEDGRWSARGQRWVPSKKAWDRHAKTYGGAGEPIVVRRAR